KQAISYGLTEHDTLEEEIDGLVGRHLGEIDAGRVTAPSGSGERSVGQCGRACRIVPAEARNDEQQDREQNERGAAGRDEGRGTRTARGLGGYGRSGRPGAAPGPRLRCAAGTRHRGSAHVAEAAADRDLIPALAAPDGLRERCSAFRAESAAGGMAAGGTCIRHATSL